MKSPTQFIVKPVENKRYNNTKRIGEVDFIVNTSEEDFRFSNREAIVVETPILYQGPISKGDRLIVHHNVFKFYNDIVGRRKSGKSFLRDNHFLLDYDQFFAYNKDVEWDGWIGHDKYCFVKPLKKEQSAIYQPLTYEPLVGEITIINQYLKDVGVSVGDKVSFKPESEYEFRIDGQLMYRLFDSAVTIVL